MYFKRYYLGCLAHASYMIADEDKKLAVVVDPQRDVEQYMADAAANGFQIRYVFLTHFHADFVAGHIELRNKTGAEIYLGEMAKAEYKFTPVKDGDVIEFGHVRLAILATPGHTPEGISLLIYDLANNDRMPRAVLTGDTLFIGDVGRPDLLASIGVTADELADMLFDSLHNKLMKLPDETLVYPAHGAGSMCGKQLSNEEVSTIGDQRKYNYAVQPMSRQAFKRLVTADQPEAPDYFVHDAIFNRQDRVVLDDTMQKSRKPLDLQEVVALQRDGAQVIDVRDPADFAGAHLAGTLNIPLDGKYATWCGTVLDKAKPIVVVAHEEQVEEAILRLGRIGFDQVVGFLEHGPKSLGPRPDLVGKVARVTANALREQIEEHVPLALIDVRRPTEWEECHIEGSTNIPLNQLQHRISEIPRDRPAAVHCRTGYRSSLAASILQGNGMESIVDLVGGIEAWKASQLPMIQVASA